MVHLLDIASVGGAGTDWRTLYQQLEVVGRVPTASSSAITPRDAIVRGMYVNLDEVRDELRAAGVSPTHVTIYADVLELPANLTWRIEDSSLLVYARVIKADPSASILLNYQSTTLARLVLFADRIDGTLTAHALTKDADPIAFPLDTPTVAAGVLIRLGEQRPVLAAVPRQQGLSMDPTSDFATAMTTEFIFASLVWDENPALALDMLTWVRSWAAASRNQDLLFRSTSLATLLAAQMSARAQRAAFVPYLTASVYTDLASAFADQAGQYEHDYLELATQQTIQDTGISFAKALLDNAIHDSDYVTALLAQAQANLQNAQAAADAAQTNFRRQQVDVQRKGIVFNDVGIPEYKEKKIIDAVLDVTSALLTFGVAIGEMAVGNEAAAPQAAEGAIEGAKAVKDAANTGAALAKTMQELKEVIDGIQALYDLSKSIADAAAGLVDVNSLIDRMQSRTDSGAVLPSGDAWQIFALQAHGALKPAIDASIGSARDYQDSIDEMAIYGKSLLDAKTAAIQAAQECLRVTLQRKLAEEQQGRLQALVDSLVAGSTPTAAMMQQFYLRYLDAKSALYAALQNYRAAFFYWSLTPSTVPTKIVEGVKSLETGVSSIAAIALDKVNALSRFDPPPQPMTDKHYTEQSPAVLASLRTSGETTVVVPMDADAFVGLTRVRIDTIRVWLEGARVPYGKRLSVRVSSSGRYLDRGNDGELAFISKPLSRLFEYHVQDGQSHEQGPAFTFANGDVGFIEIDGGIDNEVKYAYFQPTPFSEWTLTVDPGDNRGIDLSGVTGITLQFRGTVTAPRRVS